MDFLHTISQTVIDPPRVAPGTSLVELIDRVMLSYNAGRLREACQLFARRMLSENATVGLSISGALTPAGLGQSCLVPLVRAGFVDWIVSTGANLYHDTHFALNMPLHQSRPCLDDRALREHEIIRIYDVVFDAKNLYDTDAFYAKLLESESLRGVMGTAEFHWHVGRYLHERAGQLGADPSRSLLAACYEMSVPIYTSSPGDSSIGMNVAAAALAARDDNQQETLRIDPSIDVNETAALVHDAQARGTSCVLILGGGSPKNFVLQTEPQLQEVLGLPSRGHDYFIQFTDARPDTGGLSGATPSEAMTWGKVDPEKLPQSVTCYVDTTIALPLLTAYALASREPRPSKRLYERRAEAVRSLREAYLERLREDEGK